MNRRRPKHSLLNPLNPQFNLLYSLYSPLLPLSNGRLRAFLFSVNQGDAL